MNNDQATQKLLSMLSLARKAGKVISGADTCEKAIRNGKALLVFAAADASAKTLKKFRDKTTFYNIPLSTALTTQNLTQIGLDGRTIIAVTDQNFAKTMIQGAESRA